MTAPARWVSYIRTCSRQPDAAERQRDAIRVFAKARGWMIEREYEDRGVVGTTLDRPALNALLNDAAQGAFDRLVVATADRLSRVIPDVLALVGELDRVGVTVTVARSPEVDWASVREVFDGWHRIGCTRAAESADQACAVCGRRL